MDTTSLLFFFFYILLFLFYFILYFPPWWKKPTLLYFFLFFAPFLARRHLLLLDNPCWWTIWEPDYSFLKSQEDKQQMQIEGEWRRGWSVPEIWSFRRLKKWERKGKQPAAVSGDLVLQPAGLPSFTEWLCHLLFKTRNWYLSLCLSLSSRFLIRISWLHVPVGGLVGVGKENHHLFGSRENLGKGETYFWVFALLFLGQSRNGTSEMKRKLLYFLILCCLSGEWVKAMRELK